MDGILSRMYLESCFTVIYQKISRTILIQMNGNQVMQGLIIQYCLMKMPNRQGQI